MPVIPSFGRFDNRIATDASIESAGEFEENVLLKRYTGITPGDQIKGIADTVNYTKIRTTASIRSLTAKEIATSGNLYAIGDLMIQIRRVIYGEESGKGDYQSPGRRSDQILYRGRPYKLVGHPDRKFFAAVWYWECVMRQDGKS